MGRRIFLGVKSLWPKTVETQNEHFLDQNLFITFFKTQNFSGPKISWDQSSGVFFFKLQLFKAYLNNFELTWTGQVRGFLCFPMSQREPHTYLYFTERVYSSLHRESERVDVLRVPERWLESVFQGVWRMTSLCPKSPTQLGTNF